MAEAGAFAVAGPLRIPRTTVGIEAGDHANTPDAGGLRAWVACGDWAGSVRGVRDVRGKLSPLSALHEDVVLARVPYGTGASMSAKTFADELVFCGGGKARLLEGWGVLGFIVLDPSVTSGHEYAL
jgi:hypothetical protein